MRNLLLITLFFGVSCNFYGAEKEDRDKLNQERIKGLEMSLQMQRKRAYELHLLCEVQGYIIIKLTEPKELKDQQKWLLQRWPETQKVLASEMDNFDLDMQGRLKSKLAIVKKNGWLVDTKKTEK